jgi:hypothetical protein
VAGLLALLVSGGVLAACSGDPDPQPAAAGSRSESAFPRFWLSPATQELGERFGQALRAPVAGEDR